MTTSAPRTLKIGARGSPLAQAQATAFADSLVAAGGGRLDYEILSFTTTGDKLLDKRLQDAGGKGLFTRELDIAQQAGDIDIAVHSLKDVPSVLADGLTLACFTEREDPRDALIGPYPRLEDLPEGAVVGTASLRRQAQLLAHRPDLEIIPFRGNVQTRLNKLADGQADATLLAAAGLHRLGLSRHIAGLLPIDEVLPAGGQGIVTATLRDDAPDWLTAACAAVDDWEARCAAIAERAFLKRLDGSCRTPIAAHFRMTSTGADMSGEVLSEDGRSRFRADGALARPPSETDAAELGAFLAEDVAAHRSRAAGELRRQTTPARAKPKHHAKGKPASATKVTP